MRKVCVILGMALAVFQLTFVFPRAVLAGTGAEPAHVAVGKPAPHFSVRDANGKTRSLREFKGKVVVLEWFNFDCPFSKKHYDSGNMQSLQKAYTQKGVIWLSVNSSAKGKPGYHQQADAQRFMQERNAAPSAILLDSEGTTGRLYGARTTPEMFVIDQQGLLVYHGAIDDKPTFDAGDIKSAKNYVRQALDEILAGKKVSQAMTKPYGCSVKYQ